MDPTSRFFPKIVAATIVIVVGGACMVEPFRNARSVRKGTVLACVLAVLAPIPTPCLGVVELMDGNQPVRDFNDAAWPGLVAVVNDPSRVLFASGPTTEQTAFYQGDTAALERILRAFAAVEIEERVVILRPGRGVGWPWTDKAPTRRKRSEFGREGPGHVPGARGRPARRTGEI